MKRLIPTLLLLCLASYLPVPALAITPARLALRKEVRIEDRRELRIKERHILNAAASLAPGTSFAIKALPFQLWYSPDLLALSFPIGKQGLINMKNALTLVTSSGVTVTTRLTSAGTFEITSPSLGGTGPLQGAGPLLGGSSLSSGPGSGDGGAIVTGPPTIGGSLEISGGNLYSGLTVDKTGWVTISQPVSGTAGIVVASGGTLTLSGSNSYAGGTIVNAVTLIAANRNALGNASLLLNGGALEVDASQSEIDVKGNLEWSGSSSISLVLTPDPSTSQFVHLSGMLTESGSTPLNFSFTPTGLIGGNDYDFLVMVADGGFGGLTPSDFTYTTSDPGMTGTFSIVGNDLYFNDDFNPVPEPSSMALMVLGVGLLVIPFVRRRLRGVALPVSQGGLKLLFAGFEDA